MNNKELEQKKKLQKIRQRNQRIREKQRKRKVVKRYFTLTIMLYIFLLLAILFIFSISLKSCEKAPAKNDVVINHEDISETLRKKDLYYDEEFYLPVSAIATLTSIQVTGDNSWRSFIIEQNGEHAKFEIDSTKAEVNSNPIELSHKALMVNGELYLPFDFYTENMLGLDLEINEKKKQYTIALDENVELQFILKAPKSTPSVSEGSASEVTEEPIDFKLDLSSYEEYMNPEDRDKYLFIVNEENPLTRDYVPADLTGSIFTRSDRDTRTLSKYACLALEAFLKEGEANGVKGVTVTSAYRSYDYQEQLFNQEVYLLGSKEAAAKSVNPPGISEHQTGLAVDMHNMSSASTAFGKTDEAKWLAENAHKFGFILRYPADKTDVTGISYEPWHFRYVGRYHATKMYELDMCLEEYMEYINN